MITQSRNTEQEVAVPFGRDDYDYLLQALPELQRMAAVNANYQFDTLTESARNELATLLYNEKGKKRPSPARERRILAQQVVFQRRTDQIMRGTNSAESADATAEPTTLQHPRWQGKTRGATAQEFQERTRDEIKRWMELFEDPNDHQNEVESAAEIIFSPARVADKKLEAFDLTEFICDKDATPEQRMMAYAQAEREIKIMLDSLEFMSLEGSIPVESPADEDSPDKPKPNEVSQRMFRITKGRNKGKIMVTQHKDDGELTFQVHDLASAERRIIHARGGHERSEIRKFALLKTRLRVLHSFTGKKNWAEVRNDPLIQRTLGEIDEILDSMKRVTNKKKQAIRTEIEDFRLTSKGERKTSLQDRRGTNNPSAARLQIERLLELPEFTQRAQEVRNISGHLRADEDTLKRTIAAQREFFSDFTRIVQGETMPSGVELTETQITAQQEFVRGALEFIKGHNYEPFLSFALLIESYLNDANDELQKLTGEVTEKRTTSTRAPAQTTVVSTRKRASFLGTDSATGRAKQKSDYADTVSLPVQFISSAYVGCKLEQITEEFLKICEDLATMKASERRFSVMSISDSLDAIMALRSRNVATSYYPIEFNDIWAKIKEKVQELKQDVSELGDAKNNEAFKQKVKSFIADDIMRFAKRLGTFRNAAHVDTDGEVRYTLAFIETMTGSIPPRTDDVPCTLADQPQLTKLAARKVALCLDRTSGGVVRTGDENLSMVANEGALTPSQLKELTRFFGGVDGVAGHNLTDTLNALTAAIARGKHTSDKTPFDRIPKPNFIPETRTDVAHAGRNLCKLPDKNRRIRNPNLGELHSVLFNVGIEENPTALQRLAATYRCYIELARRGVINIGEN